MSEADRLAGAQALRSGSHQEAVELLSRAVTANPQDAQAHGFLGMAYGQLNAPEKAIASLREATRLAPQSAALRYNLGAALERAGQRAEAVAEYREALARDRAYERAGQALARLGEPVEPAPGAASPAPTAPASFAPAALSPAPAAPAPPLTGLSDFALPGDEPRAAPVSPGAATITGGPPPAFQSAPPAPAAYAGPPSYGGPPGSGGPSGYAAGPPGYGGPPAGGSAPGSQTVVDWSPPGAGAPPSGPQPLGDWTPPAPPVGAPLPSWHTAPPQAPANPYVPPAAREPVIATVEAPERSLSPSEQLGHAYLAGMGMGLWWGLLGAVMTFLRSMFATQQAVQSSWPLILTMCLMNVAFGALVYGVIGMIGSKTDDAEQTCGNLGLGLGICLALFSVWIFRAVLFAIGMPSMVGSIWVSRKLGQALGSRINEMSTSIFVVASSKGVEMTPHRPH